VIESRGEPIAELRPVSQEKQRPLPDMTRFWNEFPQIPGDSTEHISEDRER
jgi:antitoxin (DNA-binding transcriptional repressor) of toxin-antitoxin stability system